MSADEARDALRRAAFVAEHLWQMVDRDTWRGSGAFAEGIYEGEVRADEVRHEIEGWKKLAGGASTTETAKPSNQELAAMSDRATNAQGFGYVKWLIYDEGRPREVDVGALAEDVLALVARVEALLAELRNEKDAAMQAKVAYAEDVRGLQRENRALLAERDALEEQLALVARTLEPIAYPGKKLLGGLCSAESRDGGGS